MIRGCLVFTALALTACQPAEQGQVPETDGQAAAVPEQRSQPTEAAPDGPAPTAGETGDRIDSAQRLVGEYRVAGAGGQGIDLPYGISASISEDRIHVTADCLNMAWSYRLEQGVLETERVPVRSCRRGLTPEEQAIADAFDAATAVSLNRANGYEFTGGGHSVTLFTQ